MVVKEIVHLEDLGVNGRVDNIKMGFQEVVVFVHFDHACTHEYFHAEA